jgi:hypothetical protein
MRRRIEFLLRRTAQTTSRILDFDLVVVFFYAKEKSYCAVRLGEGGVFLLTLNMTLRLR